MRCRLRPVSVTNSAETTVPRPRETKVTVHHGRRVWPLFGSIQPTWPLPLKIQDAGSYEFCPGGSTYHLSQTFGRKRWLLRLSKDKMAHPGLTSSGGDYSADHDFVTVNRTLLLSQNLSRLAVVSRIPCRNAIQPEAYPYLSGSP